MKIELLNNKVFLNNQGSKKEIHPFWLRERVNGETYVDKKGDSFASLVECKLETGRTHQIRVHLTEKGNPIIGDKVYGRTPMLKYRNLSSSVQDLIKDLPGQALHAYLLGFNHPTKNKIIEFQSLKPEYLSNLINSIKN